MWWFQPRITAASRRDGLVAGEIGSYSWEARIGRGSLSYGINPGTLYKGDGRVARLVLYRRVGTVGLRRKIAAYDRGWLFGRRNNLEVIRKLVEYLEMV
ncbi:MAG: hypothetical protein M1598_08550 [Actinobacteria bacterium]|nr:hypothetical protein [Actinomycetota bacterium]